MCSSRRASYYHSNPFHLQSGAVLKRYFVEIHGHANPFQMTGGGGVETLTLSRFNEFLRCFFLEFTFFVKQERVFILTAEITDIIYRDTWIAQEIGGSQRAEIPTAEISQSTDELEPKSALFFAIKVYATQPSHRRLDVFDQLAEGTFDNIVMVMQSCGITQYLLC